MGHSGKRAAVCEWGWQLTSFPSSSLGSLKGCLFSTTENIIASSRSWEFKIKTSAGSLFWKISGRGLPTSLSLRTVSSSVSASGFPTPSLSVCLCLLQGHLSFGLGPTRRVTIPGSLIASAMTPFQIPHFKTRTSFSLWRCVVAMQLSTPFVQSVCSYCRLSLSVSNAGLGISAFMLSDLPLTQLSHTTSAFNLAWSNLPIQQHILTQL